MFVANNLALIFSVAERDEFKTYYWLRPQTNKFWFKGLLCKSSDGAMSDIGYCGPLILHIRYGVIFMF